MYKIEQKSINFKLNDCRIDSFTCNYFFNDQSSQFNFFAGYMW